MTVKPIITAADGSPVSYAAVAWAAEVAARRKAPLRISELLDPTDDLRLDGRLHPGGLRPCARRRRGVSLAEAEGRRRVRRPNNAELDVTTELADEAITPVLDPPLRVGATDLVVGSRGMGAIARTLVGSVARGSAGTPSAR